MDNAAQEQQRWYQREIPLVQQVIVDVGAHVGELSQFFWEAGQGKSRVVSIEPLAENVARIRERIRRSGAKDWTVQACAVSDQDGQARAQVARLPSGGWNSVLSQRPDPGGRGVSIRSVPMARLATLVPDATVVKLDIEGHEYAVLEDALPTLPKVHTWALELHWVAGRPLEEVLALLSEHGYRLLAAGRHPDDRDGAWTSAPITPDLGWEKIPVAKQHRDGRQFKMLHVIASKQPV